MVVQIKEEGIRSPGTVPSPGSTKLSKRVGWLNFNGNLANHIKFSEVKDLLESMEDTRAMKLLKDVEEKAASIRDPTGYIKVAVRKATGGSALPTGALSPQPGMNMGMGMGIDQGGGMVAGGGMSGAMPAASAAPNTNTFAPAPSGDMEKVKRRIGWLNANGNLQGPLVFDKVGMLLVSIGDAQAMDILKKLEEHALEVRDPTGWVVTAARKMLPGGAPVAGGFVQSPTMTSPAGLVGGAVKGVIKTGLKSNSVPRAPANMGDDKLRKRVSWLCANVPFARPLHYDKIAPELSQVGITEAMVILKQLEESAATVRDPDGWVIQAARRHLSGAALVSATNVGIKSELAMMPMMGQVGPSMPLQMQALGQVAPEVGADRKLQQRIDWLINNVPFAAPLIYDKVAADLLSISSTEAMLILKQLEESASTVRDPNAWVIMASRRYANSANQAQATVRMPAACFGTPDAEADQKLRKRIGWLNTNGGLIQQLVYDRVKQTLLSFLPHKAMEILKELEENAATVEDPNAFVESVAQRHLGGACGVAPGTVGYVPGMSFGGASASSAWGVPAGVFDASVPNLMGQLPMRADPTPDEKIRKRVGWLNKNQVLLAELRYDEVAPALLSLDSRRAMEVLKSLEENAPSIPDPNGYVIATAKREHQESGGVAQPAHALGAHAAASAPVQTADETTIAAHIAWLNSNIPMAEPLQIEKVLHELTQVSQVQAMDILKKLETSSATVRDPTGWVLVAVRRIIGGVPGPRPGSTAPPHERLMKRITWLNENAQLASPLIYEQVAPSLLALEPPTAMMVLKTLEENASTVLDPQAYVASAAQRFADSSATAFAPEGFTEGFAGSAGFGLAADEVVDGSFSDMLRKRIAWLNASVPLACPISPDHVLGALLEVDVAKALEVLESLEDGSVCTTDPNVYIIGATQGRVMEQPENVVSWTGDVW